MKQYLLLTSAFVAGGLLSGTAGAACIKTPTCSSLGYESTTSCTGGVKCPFGNAWNCTGPNNTTKINSINTSITNILNRITKLENNSGSGSGSGAGSGSGSGASSLCESCNVGDFICGGKCYAPSIAIKGRLASDCTYYVSKKENGVCTRITTGYGPAKTLTAQEWAKDANFGEPVYSSYFLLLNRLCSVTEWNDSVMTNMYVPVSVSSIRFDGNYLYFLFRYTRTCAPGGIALQETSVKCSVNDLKTCFGNTGRSFRVPVESTF